MFLPKHVYLLNTSDTDRLVRLNHKRDVSVGSMRRGATANCEIHVKRARATDVTKELNIDHDTALSVVKSSPEIKRWADWIKIIDGDVVVDPATLPASGPDTPPPEPCKNIPTLEPPNKPALIRARKILEAQERARLKKENSQRDLQEAENTNPTTGASTGVTPPAPVIRPTPVPLTQEELAAQGDPSITWKRERLEAYANAIGIKTNALQGKAQILRAIRNNK